MELLCCIAAIGLHLGSSHIDAPPRVEKFNDFNPGVYVEFKSGVVVGGYYNSIRKPSVYLVYRLPVASIGQVDFDLTLGLITGYRAAPVVVGVTPGAKWNLSKDTSIRVSYLPKIRMTQAHVVHFSIERKF